MRALQIKYNESWFFKLKNNNNVKPVAINYSSKVITISFFLWKKEVNYHLNFLKVQF